MIYWKKKWCLVKGGRHYIHVPDEKLNWMLFRPGAAIQACAIKRWWNEMEFTIHVQPELNRSEKPHSPPGPSRPPQLERYKILLQWHINDHHLLWSQRYWRRRYRVGQFQGAILAHIERLRDQFCYLCTLEAENETCIIETCMGPCVVVLPLDYDSYLRRK